MIISPHFPPINAADMHRIRHSLPYFRNFGWDAEVITVKPEFVESYSIDQLLVETIPKDIPVHYVDAWEINKTRKFGLGNVGMRSFFQFRKKGNELLKKKKFDLVYFSTTAFHVMALGPYWQRRFKIPFIVDIQDPWRNDFYLDKPASQRPKKFWFAYTIDKLLEAYTIPRADGVISVSVSYCKTFKERYKKLKYRECKVIPFGGSVMDFSVMENSAIQPGIQLDKNKINLVYIGRGGHDMNFVVKHFFEAIRKLSQGNDPTFSRIQCWFIGTSYALPGKGKKTIEPVAREMGLQNVTEITDRIPFFETLKLMRTADVLFVPGSTDAGYTASKIYPYILAEKPLLAIFNKQSSVVDILKETGVGEVISFASTEDSPALVDEITESLKRLIQTRTHHFTYNRTAFDKYSAETMTRRQSDYFDNVLNEFRS